MYPQAVVYQSEELKERMGSSDYRVVLLIDRRGANIFNQDIELYKAFFKVRGSCVMVHVRQTGRRPESRPTEPHGPQRNAHPMIDHLSTTIHRRSRTCIQ